jgi:hypothetical protein
VSGLSGKDLRRPLRESPNFSKQSRTVLQKFSETFQTILVTLNVEYFSEKVWKSPENFPVHICAVLRAPCENDLGTLQLFRKIFQKTLINYLVKKPGSSRQNANVTLGGL